MSVSKKHFVRITTWDDIFKLSGYTDSIDPKKEKLKQVITKYELPNKGRCGLSNCRTPHNNKLSREIDYFNKVESIKLAKSNVTENYRKLSEIEADWKKIESVYRNMKSEGLECLYNKLEQMMHSKSSSISIQRRATKPEIEFEEVRTGKTVQSPFYISENLGNLKGLGYLVDRIKIKDMIQNNKVILESLEKFDEENIAFKDPNKMTKDNERLKDSIYEVHSIIREGFKLFEADNMRQFTPLISSKRHRKLRRFLNCCFES